MNDQPKIELEKFSIGTLPVGCLTKSAFRIPKYQRGYRWKMDDVEKLLNDLKEFLESPQDARSFYCLQPLVVTKSEQYPSKWEVVDGQQRLTTLFLIWHVLNGQAPYELSYETRDLSEEFLKDPKPPTQERKKHPNIDFHHIYFAHQKIQNWFTSCCGCMKDKFRTLLSDSNPKGRNVRFIWYRIQEGADADAPEEVFTRLNDRKIPLTDEELIRALFLSSNGTAKLADDAFQHRLALEWDRIETTLQEPDFWGFLSHETPPEGGRIRLLFQLCAPPPLKGKDNGHYLFTHYHERLTGTAGAPQKVWKEIITCFEQLEEWYRDPELFHLVGYLTSILGNASTNTLRELREEANKTNKSVFADNLRIKIREKLITSSKNLRDFIAELDYTQNSGPIRPTLALFNIATLLRSRAISMRFPFHLYHENRWDIEHVHSQGGQNLRTKPDQKEWLNSCLHEIQQEGNQTDLVNAIGAFLNDQPDAPEFTPLYKQVGQFFGEDGSSNEVHRIGNLTLLDQSTNRGYGNAPFVRKRAEILEVDHNGTFILPCTRDLFLKVFSKNAGNLRRWDIENDGAAHKAAICDALETFFGEQRENQQQ